MSDHDAFARILASLYQATLDDRHWPVTSALIDEACGITGNCLLVGEGPPDDIRAMFVGVYARGERQADLEREYLQVYHPLDEAVPRLRQLPDSQVVPIADLYTAEELKRSPSYNDILRRAHYQQGLNVRLDGPDRSHMTWGLGDPVASDGDTAFSKPSGGSSDGVYTYTSISSPLLIKVEGTTNPEVLVSITGVTVTEGVERTADFVVSLSRKATGPVQVSYSTVELTGSSAADEGSDYEATSGTLTFRPGETRKTVSVPILDDARTEGDETFGLALTNLGSERPPSRVAAASARVAEMNAGEPFAG